MKKIARSLLVLAMVFGIAGTVMAAPAQTTVTVTSAPRANLYNDAIVVNGVTYVPLRYMAQFLEGNVKWNPTLGRFVVSYPSEPERGQTVYGDSRFSFALMFDRSNPTRIGIAVKNVTGQELEVTFPSSKTHDIVVKQNNTTIWQATAGQSYLPVLKTEKFLPGETKVYNTDLPALAPGKYTIEGYFMGALNRNLPVLRSTIRIPVRRSGGRQMLDYTLRFSQTVFSHREPKLLLTVKNTQGRDVYFPAGHTYLFVVKNTAGQTVLTKYVGSLGYGVRYEKMPKDASRYYFVSLKGLPAGSYTAEVMLLQGGTDLGRIGSTWFAIR